VDVKRKYSEILYKDKSSSQQLQNYGYLKLNMMWANFQEKVNEQFSLKVALVKVSIFIFIHLPQTQCI